jgi:phosphatidate cytidylyltransferase
MTRIISAIILIILVVYLVLLAPPLLGTLGLAALVVLGALEMCRLAAASGSVVPVPLVIAGSLFMVLGAWIAGPYGLSAATAAAMLLLAFGRLFQGPVEGTVAGMAAGALVLIVPAWSLAHASLFLQWSEGRPLLMYLLVLVWSCDSAAYYAGSSLGKRKLAPNVSPNKTVEGFAAGLLSALPVAVIFNMVSPNELGLLKLMACGVGITLFGQLGDLVESAIKRDAGVKDSGNIIPGHGGILDRTDSLLLTIPLFYYIFRWLGAAG